MKIKLLLILAVLSLAVTMLMSTSTVAYAYSPGDINEDGKVDILDIVLAASQYLLTPEDPGYDASIVEKADLAEPYGVIDIFDLVSIIYYYNG